MPRIRSSRAGHTSAPNASQPRHNGKSNPSYGARVQIDAQPRVSRIENLSLLVDGWLQSCTARGKQPKDGLPWDRWSQHRQT